MTAGTTPRSSPSAWQAGRFLLALERPLVMGIVNATPDSFSDGGRDTKACIAHCHRLVEEGADLLDIGGESTRPGAKPLSAKDELARVLPVLKVATRLGVPVSVDTSQAAVMAAVIDEGADIINDVRALTLPGAFEAVTASRSVGVCLMHMRGEPNTMQSQVGDYGQQGVVAAVREYLQGRVQAATVAGLSRERLCLDPGIGFGKSPADNLKLLRDQSELLTLGLPLLVGWSRKSTLGVLTGRPVEQRLPASLAAALAAVVGGANVLRVHDVAATVDALKIWSALHAGSAAAA